MKHAKGYKQYAKMDQLPQHRIYSVWQDEWGRWHCGCSYPVVGVRKGHRPPTGSFGVSEPPNDRFLA